MMAVSADQFMQLQRTVQIKMAEKIKINTTWINSVIIYLTSYSLWINHVVKLLKLLRGII